VSRSQQRETYFTAIVQGQPELADMIYVPIYKKSLEHIFKILIVKFLANF